MTKNQLDALYRVALSEYFTSPSVPPDYDIKTVLLQLHKAELLRWDNGHHLTDHGRAAMTDELDAERAEVLARLRERRALRELAKPINLTGPTGPRYR